MKAKLDWKYLVMLLVTLVGIAPSFWTSRSDLSARAFKLDKISITALDQSTPPSVKGLKLFFENQQIKDSYLSVLELSNSGSKPILTAEFESPISVFFKESNKVLRSEERRVGKEC